MNITVKTLGLEASITVENGQSYTDALAVFEGIVSKSLTGMDVFADGKPVKDLNSAIPEGTQEVVAVKSKHASASGVNITVKTLGVEISVSCDGGASCSDALAAFQKITSKVLDGMDVFKNGKPVKDLKKEKVAEGDEIVAVKSKHASA